jgi:hypothetical protein
MTAPTGEPFAAERAEVEAAYRAYIAGFLASDLAAIDAVIQYPLAYIGGGRVELLEAYPFNPSELRARTGWHTTLDATFDVAAVSRDKAHIVLSHAKRVRADGSLIETVSAFYAFTKTQGGWKLFAISDVSVPA